MRTRDNAPHSLSGVELLIVVTPHQRCSVLGLIVLSICATVVLCGGYPLTVGPTDFGLYTRCALTVIIFSFSSFSPLWELTRIRDPVTLSRTLVCFCAGSGRSARAFVSIYHLKTCFAFLRIDCMSTPIFGCDPTICLF